MFTRALQVYTGFLCPIWHHSHYTRSLVQGSLSKHPHSYHLWSKGFTRRKVLHCISVSFTVTCGVHHMIWVKTAWTLLTEPHVQSICACVSLNVWLSGKGSHQSHCSDCRARLVVLILLGVKLHIDPQPASTWTHNRVYPIYDWAVFARGACAHLHAKMYGNNLTHRREKCVVVN